MNKKQLLATVVFSCLAVSAFGVAGVMASQDSVLDNFQKRLGITLTEEQKTQIQTKKQEMETKRAEELTKWQNMTLDQWKQEEISKINSTSQEQFDQMKERMVKMLQNNGWHKGKGFGGNLDKPAE